MSVLDKLDMLCQSSAMPCGFIICALPSGENMFMLKSISIGEGTSGAGGSSLFKDKGRDVTICIGSGCICCEGTGGGEMNILNELLGSCSMGGVSVILGVRSWNSAVAADDDEILRLGRLLMGFRHVDATRLRPRLWLVISTCVWLLPPSVGDDGNDSCWGGGGGSDCMTLGVD